jgi:hypothetical protein
MNKNIIANKSPKSPTRFTKTALIALLFACNLENQKLINKYEANPIPSHPMNI